jgi:hypothetical protein
VIISSIFKESSSGVQRILCFQGRICIIHHTSLENIFQPSMACSDGVVQVENVVIAVEVVDGNADFIDHFRCL